MTAASILPSQRHLFELDDGVTYLNCAQTSPFLIAVREAAYRGIATRSKPWYITGESFFKDAEQARKSFAELVHGEPEHVAIIPSASYGMAIAAKNVPCEKGQNIIVLDEEFPSNYYAWKQVADTRGAHIRTVKRPADSDWTTAVLNAIDKDTAVLAIPNCHWTDGSLVDLVKIRNTIGDNGPALVVDSTQSQGAFPIDVMQVKPDFLICVTYKWLMGPYTFGMLYVDKKYLNGEPIENNWINRKNSEDFSRLVDYQSQFQPGARRYDMGEKSNSILGPMAIAGVVQLLEWGVPNINLTLRHLTGILAKEGTEMGLGIVDEKFRAGHMIGLRSDKPWSDALKHALLERRIYVSFRGNSIRVSPHVYNSEDEIGQLLDVVKKHL